MKSFFIRFAVGFTGGLTVCFMLIALVLYAIYS